MALFTVWATPLAIVDLKSEKNPNQNNKVLVTRLARVLNFCSAVGWRVNPNQAPLLPLLHS
jgi:hypothetical protein